MAINNFKPFATAANANVTAQADWEALPALLSGFMAGKASSAQVNKAIRQASFIAAALAQYTANKSGQDVLDNGDLNGFITKMAAAFGKDFQELDATLTALAGLATGANKLPYFTDTDKAAQTDLTQVGRDIIGKNTIADILTYLGLKQLATLNGIENSFPFFDDSNTARLSGITTVGRTVVAAEKIADIVNYLGITELLNGKQPLDATLTAIAALASSANKLPYFTGEDTVAITDLTAFARTILGRSDAAGVLSDLGLGPIATAADIQSGTAKKMVDASGLKSFLPKRNFAANDFVRIPDVPGGLIIQWGVVLKSIPEGVQNVIFPTPFPNFSLMAMATPSNLSGNAGIDVFSQVGAISNSDVNFFFSWVSTATPADGFRWFALGF
ncbi:hypothetical protein QAA37_014290 [Citrobacter freundii]|nr:hypothetical protein [Citrobacter freundii]